MRRLFNDNWLFYEAQPGDPVREDGFIPVDIPHDALIADVDGLYRDCDLWYTRKLSVTDTQLDGCIMLEFYGVYMDCDIIVNGKNMCTHRYGYTSFFVDITQALIPGENSIMVFVRHRQPSGRWYTGAGIYRDVYINYLPEEHIAPDGVYVTLTELSQGRWKVRITAESSSFPIMHRLTDMQGRKVCELVQHDTVCEAEVTGVKTWDCDNPYMYRLESTVPGQTVTQNIGFRTVLFTTDKGLFVNHRQIKLRGVCLHHDLGALGSAFHMDAEKRRLKIMRKMGVNALRTSHNPPHPEVLELCDELGIFVIDEAFDTWRRSKGAFDYSRFFDEEWKNDVALWVRRDRNHPSVIMWSIGNEILDTNLDESAQELTGELADEVRKHDPDGHAAVTLGSNFMPWEKARKCADYVDVQGYNYGEKYYAAHHSEHPDWVIYGSETASVLGSRGVYHFPMSAGILSDDDLQCSALGNSCTSWGAQNVQKMICDDLNNGFSIGQFIWSGTDYIGEPTPYHTRNSYFGLCDTACFPKDIYYRFMAAWTDEPMVHIGVSWDWNAGQMIDVPVMTNADSCELILNGRSLGVKTVDRLDAEASLPVWRIPFEKGTLKAIGRNSVGRIVSEDIRKTPGETAGFRLECEESSLKTDGRSLLFVAVTAVDADGNPVDNACDSVRVTVSGGARLMGLDNGDSDSDEEYRTNVRRLFSGKLLMIAGSNGKREPVNVRAEGKNGIKSEITIPYEASEIPEGVSCSEALCTEHEMPDSVHARRIDLAPEGGMTLTKETPEAVINAKALPEVADAGEITWSCVNAAGISSPCANIISDGNTAKVTAAGDGSVYVRATVTNGCGHPRVISQLELTVTGYGAPDFDPYSFVSAGLYTAQSGVTAGNERGIAFARDGVSWVEFERVNFGTAGSDTMTLPIFSLDSGAYGLKMYVDGEFLCSLHYQKPSIWNVYQPETYKLPKRLTGVRTLRFELDRKVHLKGFVFEKQSLSGRTLTAAQADRVYGDTFRREGSSIKGIGNNVTLEFDGLDLGTSGRCIIELDGYTPLDSNPITLVFKGKDGVKTQYIGFKGGERGVQRFETEAPCGIASCGFVFLPGSNFDFNSVKFNIG